MQILGRCEAVFGRFIVQEIFFIENLVYIVN